jgi:hypothetical protein
MWNCDVALTAHSGESARERRRSDARKGPQFFQCAIQALADLRHVILLAPTRADAKREYVFGIKSQRNLSQPRQAADKQSRAGQKHDREGDLYADQHSFDPMTSADL